MLTSLAALEGYGMPGISVDGQDVLAVREVASAAVARARAGGGPTLIDAKTYRFCEHAYRLPVRLPYRSIDEVTYWREQRDPISLFTQQCITEGWLSNEAVDEIAASVGIDVAEAVAFAELSEHPMPEAAFDDLYAEMHP